MCRLFSRFFTVMESITLSLSGDSSSLTSYFNPEIQLDHRFNYSCCLLDFSASNLFDINESNNKLHWNVVKPLWPDQEGVFELPVGLYKFESISNYLEDAFQKIGYKVRFRVDKKSMKTIIQMNKHICFDFDKPESIGELLGFERYKICGTDNHESQDPIGDSYDSQAIRIVCDLISGSYHNGECSHTIHEFYPKVDDDYKIHEQPYNLVYLPIVRHRISSVNITLQDQDGELIDFNRRQINCRIHIKKGIEKNVYLPRQQQQQQYP